MTKEDQEKLLEMAKELLGDAINERCCELAARSPEGMTHALYEKAVNEYKEEREFLDRLSEEVENKD